MGTNFTDFNANNKTRLRRNAQRLKKVDLSNNIPDGSITFAKMQEIATDTLLGRATAGTGAIETVPLTAAGRALLDDTTAANQRTTLGLGTLAVKNTADFIFHETPSGTINGVNTVFTLANTPIAGTEQVFLARALQVPGGGNDYTISGATITFAVAPPAGPLRVHYLK